MTHDHEDMIHTDLKATLDERGESYGDYSEMSHEIRALQFRAHSCSSWNKMSSGQQHAVDMIMVKLGRLLTGNPDHLDSWLDIMGYAKLGSDQIPELPPPTPGMEA